MAPVKRYVLSLPRALVEAHRASLLASGIVDRSVSFRVVGDRVEIPLLPVDDGTPPNVEMLDRIVREKARTPPPTPLGRNAMILPGSGPPPTRRVMDPFERIRLELARTVREPGVLDGLPRKWELFGDVLTVRLDRVPTYLETVVARVYADVLGARTVLVPAGGIQGVFRIPSMRAVLGTDTETVHLENGIRYRFDVARIMFSSGNVDERIRMGALDARGETVVDMFAGIGYFTLPLAVHAGVRKVFALEINPVAVRYLRENVGLNRVGPKVVVVQGDNRDFELPTGSADRVIMGYVGTTHEFLDRAFSFLGERGILHYHETCPNRLMDTRPLRRLGEAAAGNGYHIEAAVQHRIKSYAPGVSHIVVDTTVSRG